MPKRPKLLKVDPEMQRWCARLEEDVSTWPDVTGRAMFGMRAFYRGPTIFAALPRTRAMGTSHSIIVKLPKTRGEQLGRGPGAHWASFALHSADDIPEALRWIGRAYERLAPLARSRSGRRRGSAEMQTRREFLVGLTAVSVAGRTGALRAATYGLLIKGGRVIDPSSSVDRVIDVAIASGRIARVAPDMSSSEATDVIDARGKIVTPGLVDIHAHLDAEMPPSHCLSTGVTAIVDAGSRGADGIGELVAMAKSAPNRMRILLNLGRTGLGSTPELLDFANADVAAARRAVDANRDVIIGIKARLSKGVAGYTISMRSIAHTR